MLIEKQDTQTQDKDNLSYAMKQLDARSRDILQQRWLSDHKSTLTTLAEKYEVSAERVRQLEKIAMDKLRSHLENAA